MSSNLQSINVRTMDLLVVELDQLVVDVLIVCQVDVAIGCEQWPPGGSTPKSTTCSWNPSSIPDTTCQSRLSLENRPLPIAATCNMSWSRSSGLIGSRIGVTLWAATVALTSQSRRLTDNLSKTGSGRWISLTILLDTVRYFHSGLSPELCLVILFDAGHAVEISNLILDQSRSRSRRSAILGLVV